MTTLVYLAMCVLIAPAIAQPRKGGKPEPRADAKAEPRADARPDLKPDPKKKPGEKTFDFNNLDLSGRMRTPQLLYFLERANEELERASLEKRSFIPHIVRSVEEEPL